MDMDGIKIKTLFQPLYAVKKKDFTAAEALSRGMSGERQLSAGELFGLPSNDEERYLLNMACIKAALREFRKQNHDGGHSLFINFDSTLMDSPLMCLDDISTAAAAADVPFTSIVIELIESRVQDLAVLLDFIEFYRSRGFLIALDDVGSGYSSLDRIALIRPDIIKIDRSLISGVDKEFHKTAVCQSLIQLSHNIGALSLAEGVETRGEALQSMVLGADLIQGFFLAMPGDEISRDVSEYDAVVQDVVDTWFAADREKKDRFSRSLGHIKERASETGTVLSVNPPGEWDEFLSRMVCDNPEIQCCYIINERGIQTSLTHLKRGVDFKEHNMFRPGVPGTDHSFKSYFNKRSGNQIWFISDPYISRATGKVCRTVNMKYLAKDERKCYVCIDMDS